MTIESANKQTINKFFFGEMTEEERFAFEEMFITNADFLAEVKAFEDDLIEKYVLDLMDSDEKSKFEEYFLNTKKRREKVEFARDLIKELHKPNISESEQKESLWDKIGAFFSIPKLATIGLALTLLGFSSWYLLRNNDTKQPEIARNQTVNSVITNKENINLHKNTETDVKSENTNPKANTAINTENSTNLPKPKNTPKNETTTKISNPVLALFAGTMRSNGEIKELDFPQNSTGVTLQLNLKSVDYKLFQADLIDGNGNVISQHNTLKPQKSKINLFIPKEKLEKGDYRITLFGTRDSGNKESVADFQFRVN